MNFSTSFGNEGRKQTLNTGELMTHEGGGPVHHGNQPDPETAQLKRDSAPGILSYPTTGNRIHIRPLITKNGMMWCFVV